MRDRLPPASILIAWTKIQIQTLDYSASICDRSDHVSAPCSQINAVLSHNLPTANSDTKSTLH